MVAVVIDRRDQQSKKCMHCRKGSPFRLGLLVLGLDSAKSGVARSARGRSTRVCISDSP